MERGCDIEIAKDEISSRPLHGNGFKIQENDKESSSVQLTEKERKIWMAMLFIGTSLAYSCRTVMSVVAMEMANEFKWDWAQVGFLLGSFFLGYPILQIPGLGRGLRDRFGEDNFIAVCGLCWSTLTFITPIVPYAFESNEIALMAMICVRFLQGLAQGPHYPFMSRLVSATAPRKGKGFAISALAAAVYCGILVNGLLGSILLTRAFKWHYPFYLFGVLGIIWSMVMFWYLRRKYAAKMKNQSNEGMEPFIQNLASCQELKNTKPFSLRNVVTKASFWAMLLSHQCVEFVFLILLSWLPTYFIDTFPREKDLVFDSLLWVGALFSAVLSGLLGDWLLRSRPPHTIARKVLALITFLGLSIPCFNVGETDIFRLAMKYMAIVVASHAFSYSCISVNSFDIAPDHGGLIHGASHSLASLPGDF
ncbi:solute carrier family 17 member 9-like [Lytechinus variegatus]|uniref:solute carrier family 17 member 9-like n=1 Tax=Lytechinus variegatus TaxID=7654 RepID=UPI001BB1256A|nr:solute carrier family 17 member 9-like [Lytechinus variegatus]